MPLAVRTRRSRVPFFAQFAAAILGLFLIGDAVLALMIWLPYRREQQIIREISGLKAKLRSESIASKLIGDECVWVRSLVGAEHMKVFDCFTEVWCRDSAITDASGARLTGLKNLKHLGLGRTQISDDAL